MSGSPPVLLAHSYFLRYDAKQVRKMRPYPPLATLVTAAVLRDSGVPVRLFDSMLSAGEEEFEAVLAAEPARVVLILEDNFNFLTKMCTTRNREATFAMIRMAKDAGARVAVNGSDASDRPELYLEAGADAVLLGETERTARDLVEAWTADPTADLSPIHGLALASRTGVARTPPRPFVEDLDALPMPAWDLVDAERYRAAWKEAHGRFSWNAVTTRGCPYRCNWCAKPLYGVRYAQRSPESVASEMAALAARVAPDHVWFADDIFGLSKRWIEGYAQALAARGVRIPFTMQSRVDLMTPTAVEALAHAGAEEVWMGVESGSQKILDAMDKGTTLEQVRRATRLLRAAGIRPAWFLQLGYPGEGWDEILATRDLLREEGPDDVGVSVSYPLPGTLFYERVKSQIGERRNWSDSDDLAMMFEGSFTGPFYKRVRDLLHAEVLAEPGALAADWEVLAEERDAHRSVSPTRVAVPEPAGAPGR